MAKPDDLIRSLTAEYDVEHGFIGLLRMGEFDQQAMKRLLALVRSIDLGQSSTIDRDLVRLLWQMPLMIEGPAAVLQERGIGGQDLVQGVIDIEEAIEQILGSP